ncbi:MAG: acetylserotonin O-methyltransferase [Candidatus Bathyarchaeota archaeon]|nr:acetylserotonin O-methyltransferase [Candidatus Bathyarchaeota archaeon]
MKDANDLLNPPYPPSQEFSVLLEGSLDGLRRSCLIFTAWPMGLFEKTGSPLTSKQLAEAFGCHEDMMKLFCEALVEEGLLIKISNAYVNSQLSRTYLSSESPHYMKNTLKRMRSSANRWLKLSSILKRGPIMQERTAIFGDVWLNSIAEWAEVGSVASALNTLKENADVQSWRRVLDIGGGHALYSIGLTALNPDLEAYVFDLPRMVPIARKYTAKYGADHVHILPGDFYKDPVGSNYDAIFSSFNQSCTDPALIPILFDAAKEGGDVVLRRFRDETREGALRTLDWNLLGFEGKKIGSRPHSSDKVVDSAQYLEQLKKVGFEVLKIVPVDEISEMVFARKPQTNVESEQ